MTAQNIKLCHYIKRYILCFTA